MKTPLAILLAALAMFVWGWIFWGLIGGAVKPMKTLSDEADQAVVAAMKDTAVETGVYYSPGMPDGKAGKEGREKWMTRHAEGPLFEINYVAEGKNPMAPSMMVGGFLHMLISAALLAWLLGKMNLKGFACRFGAVLAIAVIAATWIDCGKIVWFYHPVSFELFNWFYHVTGFLVGGAVLAAMMKPKSAAAGETAEGE